MGGVGSGRKKVLSEEERKLRKKESNKRWVEKNYKFYLKRLSEIRKKNRTKYRATARRWEEKNRDHLRARVKKWKEKNKDKIQEINRRYYYKKKQKEMAYFLSVMKYERSHPDRMKRYYQENKEKIIARAKENREKRRLMKAA